MTDHQASELPLPPAPDSAADAPTMAVSAADAPTMAVPAADAPTMAVPAADPYGTPAANPYGTPAANPYGTPAAQYYAPPAPPAAKRSIKRFWPILFVVVLAVLAGAGKIIKDHNTAGRDASGNISKKGDLSAFSVKTGDCFQAPTDGMSFATVTAVPCDQPHTAQVYGSFDYPGATKTAPATADLDSVSTTQCEQFQSSVDETVATADNLSAGYIYPDTNAWAAGNTTVLCVVSADTAYSGTALTG